MLYAVIARWADRQNLSSLSPTLSSRQPLKQSARKPRHPQPFPLFRNLTMSARVTKHAGSTHSAHCVGGKVEDQLSIKTKKFKRFENWTLTQRSFLAPSRLLWRREGEVDHPHQQHRQQHHHYLASWAKVDHADIIIMLHHPGDQEADCADAGHSRHLLLCLSPSIQGRFLLNIASRRPGVCVLYTVPESQE